tara:strand:+ start:189 stop:896 length:708 start_codon:yes stop_codon:yes gene_type:complete
MRFLARLDIKNEIVIKGINFEGLRKIGDPLNLAKKYYTQKIDEILLIDAVASLYRRNNLFEIIKKITTEIFCPITLGGGIRSLKDIEKALLSGVDKIAINSYATERPDFLKNAVKNFGSSTIISNIEAKKTSGDWEVYKHYGREKTGYNITDWIKIVQDNGCGEILLTSIDKEGSQNGMDYSLLRFVYDKINCPLIFSGGFIGKKDIKKLKKFKNLSISTASALHYNQIEIKDFK